MGVDVGGWRLDRECVMSLPGCSLHLKLKLPSSGVIIDFDLTGIWTFAELTTGQAGKLPKSWGSLDQKSFSSLAGATWT